MSTPIVLNEIKIGDKPYVWADIINSNFEEIKKHNHDRLTDSGLTVNMSNVVIKTDLNFSQSDTLLQEKLSSLNESSYIEFTNKETSFKRTLHVKENELCFYNDFGFDVMLTKNGSLNVQNSFYNGFAGNPNPQGAFAYYNSDTRIYTFQDTSGLSQIKCKNIYCENLNTYQQITQPDSVLNIKYLSFTNFTSASDGNYLVKVQDPYNITVIPEPLSNVAITPTEAQESINQYNIIPQKVNSSFTTVYNQLPIDILDDKSSNYQILFAFLKNNVRSVMLIKPNVESFRIRKVDGSPGDLKPFTDFYYINIPRRKFFLNQSQDSFPNNNGPRGLSRGRFSTVYKVKDNDFRYYLPIILQENSSAFFIPFYVSESFFECEVLNG